MIIHDSAKPKPDPRFEPTPESPAWLAAMNDADLAAERWLEEHPRCPPRQARRRRAALQGARQFHGCTSHPLDRATNPGGHMTKEIPMRKREEIAMNISDLTLVPRDGGGTQSPEGKIIGALSREVETLRAEIVALRTIIEECRNVIEELTRR